MTQDTESIDQAYLRLATEKATREQGRSDREERSTDALERIAGALNHIAHHQTRCNCA